MTNKRLIKTSRINDKHNKNKKKQAKKKKKDKRKRIKTKPQTPLTRESDPPHPPSQYLFRRQRGIPGEDPGEVSAMCPLEVVTREQTGEGRVVSAHYHKVGGEICRGERVR